MTPQPGAMLQYDIDELLNLRIPDETLLDNLLAAQAAEHVIPADDVVSHWKDSRAAVEAARERLADAQLAVRGAAALEDGDALHIAATARNEARTACLELLNHALEMHEDLGAEAQRDRLQDEATRLAEEAARDAPSALGPALTRRMRRKHVTEMLLPELDAWTSCVSGFQEERDALQLHAAGEAPSMEGVRCLETALKQAKKTLRKADFDLKDAMAEGEDLAAAQASVRSARRAVQAAERALHRARTELASVASVHFPEMLVREALLRIGSASSAVDGEDEVGARLVERELAHYDKEARTISVAGARHKVWKATYDGEPCVLKEYELDDKAEWKALAKEVKLLGQLGANCPYIADVQAVFLQPEPYVAYVQLPYYNGGDLMHWLGANSSAELWRRKALLGQLCEALRHVHAHGVAHGDVKLENVLVAVEGEHATAHLADFESAHAQRTGTATHSLSTSSGGGSAFTELYVAPEILQASKEGRAADAKPTAAGDMFSYGVCCLFACCMPATFAEKEQQFRRFAIDDDRQLAAWSRDAAKLADDDLPSLLEDLLASADLRRSAAQTLLHPFHNAAAALEASKQARASAAALSHEAAQQMAAAKRKEEQNQRDAARREAELRRKQVEQEEELEAALRRNEELAERKRQDILRQERAVQTQKEAVCAQEAAVAAAERQAAEKVNQAEEDRKAAADEVARQKAKADKMRQDAQRDKAKVDTEVRQKKAELEAQKAQVEEEKKKLAKLQSEKRAMPSYWEKSLASKAKDGFALLALDRGRDGATWKALERLLSTDAAKLKQSGADRRGTRHDRLQLACAWRLEHPPMWERYMSGQQQVLRDLRLLEKAHVRAVGGLPVATARAAGGLPGQLRADVNEAMLMHGTNPGVLLSVLSTGPNERFSGTNAGTAYGDGTYLAEDAGKNDQYVGVDERYDGSSELHKRLYGHGVTHPGKVYYLLVCRVALGRHVRTQQAGRGATSMDDHTPVFPISFRELAAVPNVTPPVHYHALLADVVDKGARYREVIVFHSELIYPEYVLAYQRFDGGSGPL